MPLATSLLGSVSNFGSPNGVTKDAGWNHLLWNISFWFALPIVLLVVGLITFALFRYRHRAGHDRVPAQFQYHIPIEAAYTIIPLIVVVVIFGFMFNAENQTTRISPNPAVKITVDGFQWGWRFVYPNGHVQIGTADYSNIDDNQGLPVLYLPANETVQLQVVSLDVVHTFYVKEFLFNRDLIPGIDNRFDLHITQPGLYPGQCNNICGEYHAYMRFLVQVMPKDQYDQWYAQQPPCSVTTAGVPGPPAPGKCTNGTSKEYSDS
jgi:cytochrome c oxidase subunit 2